MTSLLRYAVALFALGLVAAAHAAALSFDIPAQPAPAALQAFGRQAGAEVLFRADELKDIRANAVKGSFEPAAALARLLEGTGFEARQTAPSSYVVARIASAETGTGSVRGVLTLPSGDAAAGVMVTVWETAQSAVTDRSGEFFFSGVAPGTYRLVAKADGFQPLHVTDVTVRANREMALSRLALRTADEVTRLQSVVVQGESVEKLDPYAVEGRRVTPFADGNADVPRTINDVQPYYIISANTIERSGAVNIEDFLKRHVPMNATGRTSSDSNSHYGGTSSSVNLRGLGADLTLVLVNGRRVAGVSISGVQGQPDLNGIPLSMVDRIEILPSSASGIYGGSAIGGVVNVVLKKRYSGGELVLGYDNTFDTDMGARTASLTYGFSLERGRTEVLLSASWSDGNILMVQDRPELFEDNAAFLYKNYNGIFSSTTQAVLGSLPNILASPATGTLVLKNGKSLGASRTFVGAGISPTSSTAELYASLLANAGQWNTDAPPTGQNYTGTRRLFNVPAERNSFLARVSRKMNSWLEFFGDFRRGENNSSTPFFFSIPVNVAASSPVNPFTTAVRLSLPVDGAGSNESTTVTLDGSFGAIAHLPHDWTLRLDFNRSFTHNAGVNEGDFDSQGIIADVNAGRLNPFYDTLKYSLDLSKYHTYSTWDSDSHIADWQLSGAGPLPALPWGVATVNFGLETRRWWSPGRTTVTTYTATPANNGYYTYYPRRVWTDSAYAETLIPLVKKDWKFLLRGFDLQLSSRTERYATITGTTFSSVYPLATPVYVSYSGPTLNGGPVFSKARFESTDSMGGFRYRPFRDVILRASSGTAFLPPSNSQLSPNPLPNIAPVIITDPKTGTTASVLTLGGGNANVKPQHSKDRNLGLIWEPGQGWFKGLRLGAEYRETDQFDAISTLSAQLMVNIESIYPERITRNAAGTITQVDLSALNLYKRESRGWEFTLDYTRPTPVGTFALNSMTYYMLHNRKQVSLTSPMYDYAGYNPAEDSGSTGNGSGPQWKSNTTLTWERARWNLGWTANYIGTYQAYGAPGGPLSLQNAAGGVYSYYITAMGGKTTIGSQVYHDVFANYSFRPAGSRGLRTGGVAGLLDGVTLQVGVRNVLGRLAPLDASTNTLSYGYVSPYGDLRVRSYWLTLKKAF